MAEIQNFTVYRGDDRLLTFTGTANGSVAGWTTRFTARRTQSEADPPVVDLAGVIAEAGSGSTPGIFTVTVPKATLLTLPPRSYSYSLKRVDVGAAATLTIGQMTVKADILNPL